MNGDRSLDLPRSRPGGYTPVSTTESTVEPDQPEPVRAKPKKFNWNLFLDLSSIVFFLLLLLYCASEIYIHRNDQAHKHEFVLNSVLASPLDKSNSTDRIRVAWNITFNVTNKCNSSTFYYENAALSVFYGNQILWATMIPNFYQNIGDHNSVKVAMISSSAADGAYLPSAYFFGTPRPNLSPGFDLKVMTTVTEYPKMLLEHTYPIMVSCPDVKMEYHSSQKALRLTGGPRKCEVMI